MTNRFACFWILVLLFSFAFSTECSVSADEPGPPNIVFLLTDDQSFNSLGCYGNQDVKTPNIDQLASEGFVFDRHYDTTAICMASRANVFSGLYEYRTGCNFGRGDMQPEIWDMSYPKALRAAGYMTAFAGKFGIVVDGVGLPEKDFDHWGGGPGQTHYETKKNISLTKYAARYPHSTVAYGAFGQDVIRDAVQQKKPFCLSISFKAPHRPVTPDPKFDRIYANKSFEKPANYGREKGEHLSKQSRLGRQFERFHSWNYSDKYDDVMRKYHQQIYAVDVAVGMIRNTIRELGITDNTVVIFTSDNGFLCGSHGYGSKVLPYEEASRVPMIIHDPRHKNSGQNIRIRAVSGNIDIAPTICELAGAKFRDDADGKSLLKLLDDPQADLHQSLSLMNFWGPTATHSYGIVTRRWKYVNWFYEGGGMKQAEELFDMRSDQLELKNAALDPARQPELERMRSTYDQQIKQIGDRGQSAEYRKYGVLFDRTVGWSIKQQLLDGSSSRENK